MTTFWKYGRKWHVNGDPAQLEPWAADPENLRNCAVKKNAVRFAAAVTAANGEKLFVKMEHALTLPFFRSKSEKEFRSWELLHSCGIPCAEYVAWSASRHDHLTVSRALPEDCVTLIRLWYDSPAPGVREKIIPALSQFIAKLARNGVFHPDLHAGNIMVRQENGDFQFYLVDLYGICRTAPTDSPEPLMLAAFIEIIGFFPEEHLAGELLRAGLYGTLEKACSALREIWRIRTATVENEWPRRVKMILSGTSKFAVEKEQGVFHRNTAWFAPMELLPEDFSEPQNMGCSEGEKCWLDSFLAQLLRRKIEKIPVIFEKNGDKIRIFYLKNEKKSIFFGF